MQNTLLVKKFEDTANTLTKLRGKLLRNLDQFINNIEKSLESELLEKNINLTYALLIGDCTCSYKIAKGIAIRKERLTLRQFLVVIEKNHVLLKFNRTSTGGWQVCKWEGVELMHSMELLIKDFILSSKIPEVNDNFSIYQEDFSDNYNIVQ